MLPPPQKSERFNNNPLIVRSLEDCVRSMQRHCLSQHVEDCPMSGIPSIQHVEMLSPHHGVTRIAGLFCLFKCCYLACRTVNIQHRTRQKMNLKVFLSFIRTSCYRWNFYAENWDIYRVIISACLHTCKLEYS